MLHKDESQKKYPMLREGLEAYNKDGDKLGRIVELKDDFITVEKGVFFPKDFTFRYDDIVDVNGETVTLSRKRKELENWKDEKYEGWKEYDRINKGETTIPVHEEELEAQKISRPKGEVHIRKVVHTEMKQFTVPVTREEIIVERRPVTENRPLKPGEQIFKEEDIRIPVSEEEVEIIKRPVTKEEVHIRKVLHTDEQNVEGEVRKENVEINREDEQGRKVA
ncbi:MAG: YsnF/AvaK domain-containing protein [Fibrobacter sp.]|nr:YsnF/AvaK domain-containing protein [Fibrobacter sp.]